MSSIHKDKNYVFGFTDVDVKEEEDTDDREPYAWVLMGILAVLWIIGCTIMCVCLCCNKDDVLFGSG